MTHRTKSRGLSVRLAASALLTEEALRLERAIATADPRAARTPPACVSVTEFQKAVGTTRATISRWVRDGVGKSTKVGRRPFIAFSEIERIKGE